MIFVLSPFNDKKKNSQESEGLAQRRKISGWNKHISYPKKMNSDSSPSGSLTISKFVDFNEKHFVESVHTNETAVRYIEQLLEEQDASIDRIFAFVTETLEKGTLERFLKCSPCQGQF